MGLETAFIIEREPLGASLLLLQTQGAPNTGVLDILRGGVQGVTLLFQPREPLLHGDHLAELLGFGPGLLRGDVDPLCGGGLAIEAFQNPCRLF